MLIFRSRLERRERRKGDWELVSEVGENREKENVLRRR